MLKTLPFYGSCSARSETVLVSKLIRQPYNLVTISADFQRGCANLLLLRFLTSEDPSALSEANGGGRSVLAENSQVDYILGDDRQFIVQHKIEVPTASSYLKVHATNNDYFNHDVSVRITIDTKTP